MGYFEMMAIRSMINSYMHVKEHLTGITSVKDIGDKIEVTFSSNVVK